MSTDPAAAFRHGLPADWSPGIHLGRDEAGDLFLLVWDARAGCFDALGWETRDGQPWPILHKLTGDKQALIVAHTALPSSQAIKTTRAEERDACAQIAASVARRCAEQGVSMARSRTGKDKARAGHRASREIELAIRARAGHCSEEA